MNIKSIRFVNKWIIQPMLKIGYTRKKRRMAETLVKDFEKLIDLRKEKHAEYIKKDREGSSTTFVEGQLDILNKIVGKRV